MDPTVLLLLCFAGGAIAGALLAIALVRRSGREAEDRAAQLEVELAEVRSEIEAQERQIATHFGRTSDLFRDLTERYTQLYAHLAQGARQFCHDDVPAIARGLEGLLPAGEAESEQQPLSEADGPRRPERTNGGSPPPV